MSTHQTFTNAAPVGQDPVDRHLEAVLRAAGSSLRHYSMQKTVCDMREAMRRAIREEVQKASAEGLV